MRLSDDTRYPHPVLGPLTKDYAPGEFKVSFTVSENLETGSLTLRHDIKLDVPEILDLVTNGQAAIGCIVSCLDTYYIRLHSLGWDHGLTDFPAGTLLNRVTIRPIIWLKKDQPAWSPEAMHPEFTRPIALKTGDIIAMDLESTISVGQAKLASIESIFELVESPDQQEGQIEVDLRKERIAIILGPNSYKNINLLRGQKENSSVVMNAIYLPAVMEVLDHVRSNPAEFSEWRWHRAFTERCIFKGISLDQSTSILHGAQLLLENPVAKLEDILKGDYNAE